MKRILALAKKLGFGLTGMGYRREGWGVAEENHSLLKMACWDNFTFIKIIFKRLFQGSTFPRTSFL